MENKGFNLKDFLRVSHLATILLVIGYLGYWMELYFLSHDKGMSSLLESSLFLTVCAYVIYIKKDAIARSLGWLFGEFRKLGRFNKCLVLFSSAIILAMAIVLVYAYSLPIHLAQEFDALNYHYSIPRQHLILGSFKHIQWSSADLFLMPVDFALAPYWFATDLPNKFPQALFLICIILVSLNLVRRFSRNNLKSVILIILAILGSHFLGIQMGTAMLDIAVAYLFLAALDSFLSGNILIAAIEFTFYLWSKPFILPQVLFILALILFLWVIFRKFEFKLQVNKEYLAGLKPLLASVLILSALIAGPFLAKSVYYSGTPLFPFAPGAIKTNEKTPAYIGNQESLILSSKAHIGVKNSYGYTRSFLSFVKHFWLISVPTEGVNNRFDYPLGLMYLLFFGPFIFHFLKSLTQKQFLVLPFFLICYWISWWLGSQQSRFLYVPVILMMINVSSEIKNPSRIFLAAVVLALFLSGISVARAHTNDMRKIGFSVLREKDKQILLLNTDYLKSLRQDEVFLDFPDIAYARFPVRINRQILPWVLCPEQNKEGI